MARFPIHPDQPTGIIVHALHKSGTMFLYQIFYRLSRQRRIRYYSSNHRQPNCDQVTPGINHDFCLCPVRSFADGPFPFDRGQRICRIFQVRDPRDILVSQYYSYGWRHTERGFDSDEFRIRQRIRSMTIDDYVLDDRLAIRPIRKRFAGLLRRPASHLEKIVKYEQMVTDFSGWLSEILPVFEFRFPALVKARFSVRYRREFRPGAEPDSHKRSVLPGDYLRRLKPDTIGQLNGILAAELKALDYRCRLPDEQAA